MVTHITCYISSALSSRWKWHRSMHACSNLGGTWTKHIHFVRGRRSQAVMSFQIRLAYGRVITFPGMRTRITWSPVLGCVPHISGKRPTSQVCNSIPTLKQPQVAFPACLPAWRSDWHGTLSINDELSKTNSLSSFTTRVLADRDSSVNVYPYL